jgi:ATP-dependent Clp protease protease subunit
MSDEKRFMDNKNIEEVTPDMLITEYLNNTSELKDLDKISEAYDTVDRALFLSDVTPEIADAIEHIIRIYNVIDKDLPTEERKPIKLFINSNGGSAIGCLEIIDAINLSKTPVYTINIGLAASAGLDVFITGKKRFCYPNATFLFHEGSTSLSSIDAGKFRNYSDWYDRLLKRTKDNLIKNTKVTPELYKEKQNDDWWFFADEAIEYGFCDEVLEEFI